MLFDPAVITHYFRVWVDRGHSVLDGYWKDVGYSIEGDERSRYDISQEFKSEINNEW